MAIFRWEPPELENRDFHLGYRLLGGVSSAVNKINFDRRVCW